MSYTFINFASTPTPSNGSIPAGWALAGGSAAAVVGAATFRSQTSGSAVWLHTTPPVPLVNEIVGEVTIAAMTASERAGGAIMTADGSGYTFLVGTGDIQVFKTVGSVNNALVQIGATQTITGVVGDIIQYSYNKSTGAIRALQNGTIVFTGNDVDHISSTLLLGVASRSPNASVSVVSLHGVVAPADAYVDFASKPNSNPATIPAGFEILPGKLNSGIKVESGRLAGTDNSGSGIRTLAAMTAVNGVITAEIVIGVADSDYSAGIRIYFDNGLTGYGYRSGAWNLVLQKYDAAGASSNISSLYNATQTVANDRITIRYTPAIGRITLHKNDVQIFSVIDTTYTGTVYKGGVFVGGYGAGNTSLSSIAFRNVNQYSLAGLNGNNPVTSGQTNISGSVIGFTALPTITCTYSNGTKSIPITNIVGSPTNFTFTLGDRIENENCPLDGTVLTFTFTNGSEELTSGTLVYTKKQNEIALVFANAVTDDSSYLPYHIAQAGFVANGGTFYYTVPSNMPDLVIYPDGTVSNGAVGSVNGWFIPLTGSGAGTAQVLNAVLKDSGVVQYGIANAINTSRFLTATGINVDGVTALAFSGSNNSYVYTIPPLVTGVVSPRIGSRILSITDGVITDNFNVSVQPASTQSYISLTSGGSGTRYIGNYVTCVPGDQIVYDLPTELGVSLNQVTATGEIQTDFNGIQHFWHINGVTGLVTELIITTVASTFVAIDLSTCLMQMESPLFDGAYFNIDRP